MLTSVLVNQVHDGQLSQFELESIKIGLSMGCFHNSLFDFRKKRQKVCDCMVA